MLTLNVCYKTKHVMLDVAPSLSGCYLTFVYKMTRWPALTRVTFREYVYRHHHHKQMLSMRNIIISKK